MTGDVPTPSVGLTRHDPTTYVEAWDNPASASQLGLLTDRRRDRALRRHSSRRHAAALARARRSESRLRRQRRQTLDLLPALLV